MWSGGANVSRVETVHSRPKNAAGSKRNVMGGPVTGPCQGTVVHGERLVGRVVSAKGVCGRGARERGTSGYGHHTPATAASRN